MFKFHFADYTKPHEPDAQHPKRASTGRPPPMMAPVIIMGAIMMFVFWDTSERR
jgi:hypothetical protein